MPSQKLFVQRAVFWPDEVKLLIEAYEKTVCRLGAPHEARFVREAIATVIIGIAKDGELDPDRVSLCAAELLQN